MDEGHQAKSPPHQNRRSCQYPTTGKTQQHLRVQEPRHRASKKLPKRCVRLAWQSNSRLRDALSPIMEICPATVIPPIKRTQGSKTWIGLSL